MSGYPTFSDATLIGRFTHHRLWHERASQVPDESGQPLWHQPEALGRGLEPSWPGGQALWGAWTEGLGVGDQSRLMLTPGG